MGDPVQEGAQTIRLAERRVFSNSFKPLYDEGMGLVEQAAEYLDGRGRLEAKGLSRIASTLYAAESMRLTTRLMQVASWLLVRKAVHEGEMTVEEANSEKYRLATKEIARQPRFDGAEALPERLQELIERSERLYARVERLDTRLRAAGPAIAQHHPLADQLRRVEAFFRESLATEFPRPQFGRRKHRPE